MILNSHAWRPDPEVEKRSSGNGEVVTRQMTAEEREKYFGGLKPVKQTDSNGKELNESIVPRKPKKKPMVLSWEKTDKAPKEEKQVSTKRKGKWDHITKEFIEAELAKGKTTTEIEREIGMPKSGLYNLMYKYDIRSPHKGSKVVTNRHKKRISELEKELEESKKLNDSLVAEVKQLNKELGIAKGYADTAKIGQVSQAQEGNHIVIKIPIGKVVGE